MTYYSTCRQLSFGRSNFGRPTTKQDTTMVSFPKSGAYSESLKTAKSNISKKSQPRHFHHLFTSSTPEGRFAKITDEKTYKEALKNYFSEQKGSYRKFNNLLSKLKVTNSVGGEVDIVIRLVESLHGRKDLIERLPLLLPSHCSLDLQKDAIVLKVTYKDPVTNLPLSSVNLITVEGWNAKE